MIRASLLKYWAMCGLTLLSMISVGVHREGSQYRKVCVFATFLFGASALLAGIVSLFK